jgi:ABC-type phosphate transport system substrate-binding protein
MPLATTRLATLLVCLLLTACAGAKFPGDDSMSSISSYLPSVTAAPTGQGASSLDPAEGSAAERAQKARAQCWMKVEHEKNLRGIDQRIAYVEKCVTAQVR